MKDYNDATGYYFGKEFSEKIKVIEKIVFSHTGFYRPYRIENEHLLEELHHISDILVVELKGNNICPVCVFLEPEDMDIFIENHNGKTIQRL